MTDASNITGIVLAGGKSTRMGEDKGFVSFNKKPFIFYSIDALKTHGFFKGLFLSTKRIFSCHPWGKGGFDPVKKETKVKR